MAIKTFSHRGLAKKKRQENKILAFDLAYKFGFTAIETDIWFINKQLFLNHNRPNNFDNLDQLNDLFFHFKNKVEYWLDFKNLNSRNCDLALKKVNESIKENKIKLKNIYFAPFITNLNKAEIIYKKITHQFGNKAKIIAVIEKLESKNYKNFYHKLKQLAVYGLSIQYKNINSQFKEIFHDISIFAWTVNDKKVADLLEKIGVENIATDDLMPFSSKNSLVK